MIENLRTAKKVGWKTIWISPNYAQHKNYIDTIDYAFPNIYQALIYFNSFRAIYNVEKINLWC